MDASMRKKVLGEMLGDSKLIAKPICGAGGKYMMVFETRDKVSDMTLCKGFKTIENRHYQFLEDSLAGHQISATYDTEQGYIIECYAEKDPNIATFHGVDGLVYNKTFIPWFIRDHLFWSKQRECHVGNAFPTSLSVEVQARVWDVVDSIAKRMIHFGFDHQFFEAELIVFKTGKIALMEINGRPPVTMTSNAYMNVLQNGDPIAALLAMAHCHPVEPPTLKPGQHGLFGYLNMIGKGKVCNQG